jgi:putative transposase
MYDLDCEDFLKLYQTERNARGKIRFLALHHFQQGKSKKETCEMLCISHHTLNSWISWYREEGADRLRRKVKGRGIKSKLSASKESLRDAILELQSTRNGGRVVGEDIRRMILQNYNVTYHEDYIYTLLKKLGLSWISSRSKHPKSDPAAMAAFKKTFAKMS